ncbi:HET domain-containing protein [Colletotrichum higginsianum]|uniref:HET domain-containing protein n=1 Tax=Colletotrichum higginsianum (strain IMI 349063) TaxID=759273 RepID=H1UXT2_COLHI|nr:HET domain-containing protein [Colletotrichum higginsianum]
MRGSEIHYMEAVIRLDKGTDNLWKAFEQHDMFPIAENDDRVAECVPHRPIEHHAGSEDNFTRMKHWLQTCLQHHPKCRIDSGKAYTPTRLMKICETDDGDLKLRLVRTRSETEETAYVALSYCWGGDQALKCTQANVQALERDVPFKGLPKTLRDAVEVCRRLQVAYMWVDALCIIQDDEVSKLAEVGNMAQVYKNALFTICASSASSTTEGFLNYRSSPFQDPITFRVPFRNESGAETSIDLAIERYGEPLRTEPLRDRGWALQEQLLSRRRLMFTTYQLHWSCASLLPGENWIDGYKATPSKGLGVTDIPRPFVADDGLSQEVWKQKALTSWQTVVDDYVMRKLSLEEDRPLAILGIAAEFMQLFGGETYWCGMWQSSFPGCLMWKRCSSIFDRELTSKKHLPSWSWTSQNVDSLSSAKLVFGSDVQSPRGMHLNGQIWIEGRLVKDAVLQDSRYRTVFKHEVLGEAAGEVSSNDIIWFDNISDKLAMKPQKDWGPGNSTLQPMTLLEIRNFWEHGIYDFNIEGLVLRTKSDPGRPGAYERIGCFSRSITAYELDYDDSVAKAWFEKVVVPKHHPFVGADVAKILLV